MLVDEPNYRLPRLVDKWLEAPAPRQDGTGNLTRPTAPMSLGQGWVAGRETGTSAGLGHRLGRRTRMSACSRRVAKSMCSIRAPRWAGCLSRLRPSPFAGCDGPRCVVGDAGPEGNSCPLIKEAHGQGRPRQWSAVRKPGPSIPPRRSRRASISYADSFDRWIASCFWARRRRASSEARSMKKSCSSPRSRSSVGTLAGRSSQASSASSPAGVIANMRRRRPSDSRVSVRSPSASRRGFAIQQRMGKRPEVAQRGRDVSLERIGSRWTFARQQTQDQVGGRGQSLG